MQIRIFRETKLQANGTNKVTFYAKREVSLFGLFPKWIVIESYDDDDYCVPVTANSYKGLLTKIQAMYNNSIVEEMESVMI